MNDTQLTSWLRRAERDAPFPAGEHVRVRDEVLARFDRAMLYEPSSGSVADEPEGSDHRIELGPSKTPRRRRLAPMAMAAAGAVLIVGAFVAWASLGGGDTEQLATGDGAPTASDVGAQPFGPIGTTLLYAVARDGVPQGTLDLTVVSNAIPTVDRQVTTLQAGFPAADPDQRKGFGDVRFEISPDTWSIPISLGQLSGAGWPDCGTAAAHASRSAGETVEQSIECDSQTAALTATSELLGDRLAVQISLRTPDDVHELRVIGNDDGRLEQMVIQLSTTVDLLEIRSPIATEPEGSAP